jgi:hypothetical protein
MSIDSEMRPVYEETFEWEDTTGTPRTLKLQLIAQLTDRSGDRIVIALESKASGGPAAKWSDLADYHRLPFVLLHDRHHDVQPFVFSGSDGEIRPFRWSQRSQTTRSQQTPLARRARSTASSQDISTAE